MWERRFAAEFMMVWRRPTGAFTVVEKNRPVCVVSNWLKLQVEFSVNFEANPLHSRRSDA